MSDPRFKNIVRGVILLALILVGARLTRCYLFLPLVGLGVVWSLQNKIGYALACNVLCPLIIVMNPLIMPMTSIPSIALRFGPMLIGFGLMLSASRRRGNEKIPLSGLWFYLMAACISSISGYCLKVSVFKLINFSIVFAGLIIGTRNLHQRPHEVMFLRNFLISLSIVILGVSLLTLPFPAIAYPLSSRWLMTGVNAVGLDEANEIMRAAEPTMTLFAGFFMHSQTAAPMFACIFAHTLCDMLEIEKRATKLHLGIIGLCLVFLFMTRSRTGLLAFLTSGALVAFYMKNRIPMPMQLRVKLRSLVNAGVALMIVGGIALEIKSQTFSRWILKTDDLAGANASAKGESVIGRVTASRQGLIASNLDDFKKNPIFGMGFQVGDNSYIHARRSWIVLSAPIEKGVLPLMVLGEGGLVGGAIFFATIFAFYSTCIRKKYVATLSLMTCFLAVNMGEAIFFSPGGAGGGLWAYCCIGGFALDMLALAQRKRSSEMRIVGYAPSVSGWGRLA